jgi:hypothetical protein
MRRIRKLLLASLVTLAMLLPLAGAASADPNDGGIGDPTIIAGPNVITVAPTQGGATIKTSLTTASAADPNDGGIGP